MHAVILERNKLVGRRVARMLGATGATTQLIEDPAQLIASLAGADLVCADAFDGDLIAEQVRAHRGLRGVLWTAEPMRRALRYLLETAGIDHVLGRRDFETAPRSWEILMIARRLSTGAAPPSAAPPFAAYFDWGAALHELEVRSTTDRDAAVGTIQELVGALGVPRRVVEMVGELAHELLMNALYDAPIDDHGRPKYASDRKSNITLDDHERPTVVVGTDGTRFGVRVRDPFGRLERRHVVDGLARALAGGEQDRSHGGAGLGLMVAHTNSSALIFDVARGRYTDVTALLELDMNLRELRSQAKSLHFWSH
ncbi:MAG TPA: hypothetical protein VFQ53_41305 [Kofleriaceae bacterium]|nr:hypothetical protein [Kofleriaceae bacterium]